MPADSNAWNADDYDDGHGFVYEYGDDVVDLLDPQPGERILDLGCGTGHLTRRIADAGADVVGLDSAEGMIATARETYPDLEFVCADATEFVPDRSFDAVFSNAMLHWVPDEQQDAVLSTVADALSPGGRFVAELGGIGNVETLVEAIAAELDERGYEADNPWYFPSIGEYTPRLETHGFEVRLARLFDRPTELEAGLDGWLGMFGDSFFAPLSDAERGDAFAAIEDRVREELYDHGVWTADYRRLRFLAVHS